MGQEEFNQEYREEELINYLGKYITAHKKSAIDNVLAKRTRFFTVVLEDIFKPHNASAVLRTCDCFGIQDIHLIEKKDTYKINPFVTRGAAQWVDLHKYFKTDGSAVDDCFRRLRSEGYTIYGTSPASNSLSIHDLPILPNQKLALVFGNEHEGISEEVKSKVDGLAHIPMQGFTESFNISVSASIFLYELMKLANKSGIPDFYLSAIERDQLRLRWYKEIVPHADIHERHFLKQIQNLKT